MLFEANIAVLDAAIAVLLANNDRGKSVFEDVTDKLDANTAAFEPNVPLLHPVTAVFDENMAVFDAETAVLLAKSV